MENISVIELLIGVPNATLYLGEKVADNVLSRVC